jgi:hypothetical protein
MARFLGRVRMARRSEERTRRDAPDEENETMKPWLAYFEYNRDHRRNIPWERELQLKEQLVKPFIRSLQRFQLGESGEGRYLRRAANTTGDMAYIKAIDLFIREEQEHARLMAKVLKKLNAPLLTRHWSDGCFVLLRRLFGLNGQLLVLLTPEIIARRYFRAVHDGCDDETVRAMCGQILGDEEGHVAFHIAFLRQALDGMTVPARLLLREAWRILFRLAVLVVLADHRSFLKAAGVPLVSFWWDCELMFDDVSGRVFACAPADVPSGRAAVPSHHPAAALPA